MDKNIAKLVRIIDILEEYWASLDAVQHAAVVEAYAQLGDLVADFTPETEAVDVDPKEVDTDEEV